MTLKEAFEILKLKGEVEYKGIKVKAYYPEIVTLSEFEKNIDIMVGEE